MGRCARRVKHALEEELALSMNQPSVFLDETNLLPGSEWPTTLKHALCHSLVVVAICAPIYFHPAHPWCGLEWAAMRQLGAMRLAGHHLTAIIPIRFRVTDPLPEAARDIQYIDLGPDTLQSSQYHRRASFRRHIHDIAEQIAAIADALFRTNTRPNCDTFAFPADSAFSGYTPQPLLFPFSGAA